MKSADTEFVGGPLDGKVMPILLSLFHNVPKVYKVPVPGGAEQPAYTLVYRRAKEFDAKGRWRWRYEYAPGTGTGTATGTGTGTATGTGGSAGATPDAAAGTDD